NGLFKTSVTDAMGNTSQVYKDVRNLTMKTISPRGATTIFKYDGLGQLLQSVDPDSHSTKYTYDILGRTIQTEHPSRGIEQYSYDGATANPAVYTNNKGETIRYVYDILGRPTETHYSENPINDVYYQYGGNNAGLNSGKRISMQDATGVTQYDYGDMGELTAQTRMHILPTGDFLTYRTQWDYDSWGRTRTIVYPDGEKVVYKYNNQGLLWSVEGKMMYIKSIEYNKNEQKTLVNYGNGTSAAYDYDNVMWRLQEYNLYKQNSPNHQDILMHKDYIYDDIGNITNLNSNYANAGINIAEEYGYDADNQLISALANNGSAYNLTMDYSLAGKITHKTLTGNALTHLGFVNDYFYNDPNNPYAVTNLSGTNTSNILWDGAGNLCYMQPDKKINPNPLGEMGSAYVPPNGKKFFTWTEDNRLQGFYHDAGQIAALYRYDASGERELKLTATVQDVWTQNQGTQKQPVFDNATLYAGPLMTVNKNGIIKHYFMGTERILANVAGKGYPLIHPETELETLNGNTAKDLAVKYDDFVTYYFNNTANKNGCVENGIMFDAKFDVESLYKSFVNGLEQNVTDKLYYFNAGHTGNGNLITDGNGNTYQTIVYAIQGEILYNSFAGDYDESYKFSSYYLDNESSMSYAHNRYLWSEGGIFISPDKYTFQKPNISGYAYCDNNPVMYVDPDGNYLKPTTAFINSAYGAVYQKLQSNKAYMNIVGKYVNSKSNHINYNFNNGTSPRDDASAITKTDRRDYYNMTSKKVLYSTYLSNQNYYEGSLTSNTGRTLTEIGMAAEIIHESVHSYISAATGNINQSKDHNTFMDYRTLMFDALTEYNNTNKMGFTSEQLTDLSYSGLPSDNKQFQSYIQGLADKNGTTPEVEKDAFDKRVSSMIWKDKSEEK
ncbi:MAG: hypothetical protein FWD66_10555, partial [Paludibacter sp.]|nr:hypothetical protein [Paludibacter sp.]